MCTSNQNNILFKHFYNTNIGRETKSENNLYYDINKRKDAQLHLNHIFFREGRLELESCEMRNGEPFAYSITFYGKVTKFEEVFKDKTLADIPALQDVDITFNETQVVSLIQNAADITVDGTTYNDVVKRVEGRLTATSGSDSSINTVHGYDIDLSNPSDWSSFTAYNSLSESKVQTWVEAKLTADTIAQVKHHLDSGIAFEEAVSGATAKGSGTGDDFVASFPWS